MDKRVLRAAGWAVALVAVVALAGCTGEGTVYDRETARIFFRTTAVPSGGAGQFYSATIEFGAEGGAALPDRFVLASGTLPTGLALSADQVDTDGDGVGDGPLTGHARLVGYPRVPGSFSFTIRGIGKGTEKTDLVASQTFAMQIGEGSIAILNPTAEEGTVDPAVPAMAEVIDFVNPANPQAFFSFSFQVAGGSNDRLLRVYLPRELELSVFDRAVVEGSQPLSFDTIEEGDALEPEFGDGGWFSLQAGNGRVQVGGFQAPRGPVGTITQSASGPGVDARWFQLAPGDGGPALNARRDLGDTLGHAGGDPTLGTAAPVRFSDYFDPLYEHTDPEFNAPPLQRRKYPFPASEYANAFGVPYTPGVDITPLRFRAIVEAVDRRGTQNVQDDRITRRAYVVQVKIPDIRVDTVALPDGTCGVDYTGFVNASGGVPPLEMELEWVDGTRDWKATPGDALTKQAFGLEMDRTRGQFFGVPRASGTAELTVRVYAAVMNPIQGGDGYVPNAAVPGEFSGRHPVTGATGIHKTFAVTFAPPSRPTLVNKGLAPGVDGAAYPGDRLVGVGGVPLLSPDPVGFPSDYPASTAARTYAWSAEYVRDTSWGAGFETPDPDRQLPNALVLDGDPKSGMNGSITGITYDRGFHPITIRQTDAYLGDAASPDPVAFRQLTTTALALSVSPDSATYLRGVPKSDGGEPTGLLDATNAMTTELMVPMFLQAGLYEAETGRTPQRYGSGDVPVKFDILPVMLPHGGSDAHVEKDIPSVSGFWPAESASNDSWQYYYYGHQKTSWKHLQQELTWLQTPGEDHTRVYLFAETNIETSQTGATTGYGSKRYQQYDPNGKRGVMVLSPLTGDFWFPAVLDNARNDQDGSQFGAELVVGGGGYDPDYLNYYPYVYDGYWRYYSYGYMIEGDREVLLQGLGSYLETFENSSTGRAAQGRGATSVAMSADGVWCATAMPGGDGPKILLWRTDKQPVPSAMLAPPFVQALAGRDAQGAVLANSACIVDLGGRNADGFTIPTNQRTLFPDSLMFVKDGLIFLVEGALDRIFGVSLVDGHLSSTSINSRTQVSVGQGTGRTAGARDGQFAPDQDYLRGQKMAMHFAAQFAFSGNEPAAGEEGPDKVAFVAGDMLRWFALDDFSSFPRLPDQVRSGYGMAGKLNRSLLHTTLGHNATTGLDLGSSVTRDLTGSSPYLYGNLLTPGRPGEELDYLKMSPDGEYVAVVRDIDSSSYYQYYYYGYAPTYATVTTSSTSSYYISSDDVLLCSASGKDMDTASGNQTVLFLGTGTYTSSYSGTPTADTVAYCSARPYLNAKGRRINGLRFTPDSRTLILQYAGNDTYWTKYFGGSLQYGVNAASNQSTTYQYLSSQISLRWKFRTDSDGPIDFANDASEFLKNNLEGLKESGINGIGPTSAPFTTTSSAADTQFWATFQSENGNYLYYVVDQITGRNFLVGINISGAKIDGHEPFEPFTLHGPSIGFEQFDCNSWNYESRFYAVPGGVTYPGSGRDGTGIVFVIASDASASATSDTDLEVYAFDANIGGAMVPLTSAVTDGTANAINHIYCSADGNVLVGQRCKTTATSDGSRSKLNGDTDLFAVTNVHAALAGAAPDAFILSAAASHGASVGFVGEATPTGPQALVFSHAAKGANTTWAKRTLKIAVLAPGATATTLDSTESHYVVMTGSRRLDDDPLTGN